MGAVRSFSGQVVDFANNTDLYGAVEWEFREKDEAQETDAPRVVWAWKDDSTTWNPFSDENIRIIEEAHQASESTVRITSGGRRYQLDLKNNRQSNLDTHGSRVIRRTLESGAAWTCNRCSYHNAPGADQCVMCEAVRGEAL
mmetsp:Transcript_109674/g.318724  ORF Transcript_109674/g.318724 Transcript_109674/m.318724 type:complete len:142 (+) Transcript_109674:360-785(+)